MTLFLTSCKAEVIEMLALCKYSKDLTADHIFMHVHDAVMQALKDHEGNSLKLCKAVVVEMGEDETLVTKKLEELESERLVSLIILYFK
ncbi:hypothetical protein BV898_06489 [Hypsibius exemplaris]|uniref:STAS domain-containing protein n=1 Tax=Hypsibius exemplaris TaxID=2072580 RepID=A0A1W0WWC6_HYPEX|nr:hypothetical protein BV898_06489 [Hypsibius exemplaris]